MGNPLDSALVGKSEELDLVVQHGLRGTAGTEGEQKLFRSFRGDVGEAFLSCVLPAILPRTWLGFGAVIVNKER